MLLVLFIGVTICLMIVVSTNDCGYYKLYFSDCGFT